MTKKGIWNFETEYVIRIGATDKPHKIYKTKWDWILVLKCSICNYIYSVPLITDNEDRLINAPSYNFCPCCGADMEMEVNRNDRRTDFDRNIQE